jgi:hypothetical protein
VDLLDELCWSIEGKHPSILGGKTVLEDPSPTLFPSALSRASLKPSSLLPVQPMGEPMSRVTMTLLAQRSQQNPDPSPEHRSSLSK